MIVWQLDRSLRDLIAMLDELRSRGVKFHSLTEHIDIETPAALRLRSAEQRACSLVP